MAELANRMQVEADFARQMGALADRHRAELEKLLGEPPDLLNVPPGFWERVERENQQAAAGILLLIFFGSAMQHGSDSAEVVEYADSIGRSWSDRRSRDLARSYTETSRGALAEITAEWRDVLSRGGTIPPGEAERAAEAIFNAERAERVAATETTAAQSAGSESIMRATGLISVLDTWFTAKDDRVCAICGPLHAATRERWEAVFPAGPPAHPNCRCWIEYETGKG